MLLAVAGAVALSAVAAAVIAEAMLMCRCCGGSVAAVQHFALGEAGGQGLPRLMLVAVVGGQGL